MTADGGAHAPSERDRAIGARMAAESVQLDWLTAWPRVVRARADLLDAIATLSRTQAAWRSHDAEWSIEQVIRHAQNSSRDVLRVIEALAAGHPAARRTRPGELPEEAPESFDVLRHEFLAHSVHFAALPGRLPATANETLTAAHARFGELNCRAWFLFQRVHDGDHTQQIARIRATAGFPAA